MPKPKGWHYLVFGINGNNDTPEGKEKQEYIRSEFLNNKGISLENGNHAWSFLDEQHNLNPFENESGNFWDDKFNFRFIKEMDILVDHFFKRIEKVRKAWDAICEEENAK